QIIRKDFQLVILGLGDAEIQKQLEKLAKKYSKKIKVIFSMDEALAHQIESGSDFFLLPAANEPFGLNMLYSLAYGSIPIVYYGGGFVDTAVDIDEDQENGNSIVFKNHSVDDFANAFKRAFNLFADKDKLHNLIERNMSKNYSWQNSALQYDEIYRNIIKEQNA
ncbi:MAG TPA: glycosyltransferase, partial [Candidatus Kapabacteria bacterium]|nr:glycosyltransferase [Candidatus Kapabacteria bacterium]